MRIGIFTQWYEPEPGPAALCSVAARALAERGHEVHVLTGFPNYPSGRIADGYQQRPRVRERSGGVNVVRVPLMPSHDKSAMRRVANYASFGLSAAVLGVPGLPALDAVWVNYPPLGLDGALLSSLCVDPDAQNEGIGRALDDAGCVRAAELGAQTAFLTTDTDGNDAVNRFYQRRGWQLSDQYVTRQGRRMNRYRRKLAPAGKEFNDG